MQRDAIGGPPIRNAPDVLITALALVSLRSASDSESPRRGNRYDLDLQLLRVLGTRTPETAATPVPPCPGMDGSPTNLKPDARLHSTLNADAVAVAYMFFPYHVCSTGAQWDRDGKSILSYPIRNRELSYKERIFLAKLSIRECKSNQLHRSSFEDTPTSLYS